MVFALILVAMPAHATLDINEAPPGVWINDDIGASVGSSWYDLVLDHIIANMPDEPMTCEEKFAYAEDIVALYAVRCIDAALTNCEGRVQRKRWLGRELMSQECTPDWELDPYVEDSEVVPL